VSVPVQDTGIRSNDHNDASTRSHGNARMLYVTTCGSKRAGASRLAA